jgi:hypothetical protein
MVVVLLTLMRSASGSCCLNLHIHVANHLLPVLHFLMSQREVCTWFLGYLCLCQMGWPVCLPIFPHAILDLLGLS